MNSRLISQGRVLGLAALLAVAVAGCGGGPQLQMKLSRDINEGRPIWVGVYLLSKESALDDVDNSKLIDSGYANTLTEAQGVLEHELRALYAGDAPVTLPGREYKKGVAAVLVVASVPGKDCNRIKVPVKKDSDIKLRLSVDDKCVKLHKKWD